MKTLQIIQSAYRCTIEEQDDPAIWIAHVIGRAGAELDVLLRGNAVNYVVSNQDASGLAFGGISQANPPRIDKEIDRFGREGIQVYALTEDLKMRGIAETDLQPTIRTIPRDELPALFDRYQQIWHW